MLDVLSQLVTYKVLSVSVTKSWGEATNVSSYSFRLTLDEERLRTPVSTG